MTTTLLGITLAAYILLLFGISRLAGKKADNQTFFIGNRQSPWPLVALSMVGASISGVTFVSVPGWVGTTGFTYMQMVLGYFAGYLVIAQILLPLYYKLNLISIYAYLEGRFGPQSYHTGSLLFMVSRLAGSAARLYLMAGVLQYTLFDSWGIPFAATIATTLGVIWLYTRRSGLRTVIFTDSIQTLIFVGCILVTFVLLSQKMNLGVWEAVRLISDSSHARMFEFSDWSSKQWFGKQFLAGAFITIVMTGLDQDMMQKNLSCRTLKESQKNMYWYGFAFIPVNLMFLALGALLYLYAAQTGLSLPAKADELYPAIATQGHLPAAVAVLFMLGLLAAALSSADSTLTALTTSFSIDILKVHQRTQDHAETLRKWVHLGFVLLTGLLIGVFKAIGQDTILNTIFVMAGYTYGPLLGLFAWGLFSKKPVNDRMVPWAAVLAPACTGIVDAWDTEWLGFALGYEALLLNGCFMILWLAAGNLLRHPASKSNH